MDVKQQKRATSGRFQRESEKSHHDHASTGPSLSLTAAVTWNAADAVHDAEDGARVARGEVLRVGHRARVVEPLSEQAQAHQRQRRREATRVACRERRLLLLDSTDFICFDQA